MQGLARKNGVAIRLESWPTPRVEESTVVLRGRLKVQHAEGVIDVRAGQAIATSPGKWIGAAAEPMAAEDFAVCLPACSPATVHAARTDDEDNARKRRQRV